MKRRFPIGAELIPGGGVSFRVWAPRSKTAAVELFSEEGRPAGEVALAAEPGGYFAGVAPEARAGARYKIRLERGSFPDPASRFQPEGPHGPSQIVDPAFAWTDAQWRGRPHRELVIYELHLGTFTPGGTWRAAMERLPDLVATGITAVEVMPIAEFPGRFGWGYDGVDLFAPTRLYGTPDDARAFINRAHELGLAVILDVVYNHFGPDGNYLREFSPDYFSSRYANEWGDPINFDGEHSAAVREFFVANARYWIEEFHFDGLRLDATQQIFDASPRHVLEEIAEAARAGAGGRTLFIVAENEAQESRLARPPERDGLGLDALWNDDFHHSARVAATGRAEAYYSGFAGVAQEFVSAVKRGFLYQGQWYPWQQKRRGHPALDLQPLNFVHFIENHDQLANSLHGQRLHQLTSPGRLRALTALTLLSPQIPMLFQGQEFASSAPFVYFADHQGELQMQVAKGRRKFLQQFPSIAAKEVSHLIAEPGDLATFERCRLDWAERERHPQALRLHADLLRLRREDRVLREPAGVDGAVLGPRAFVLRFFEREGRDRLLVVSLDGPFRFDPAPEPLLAPADERGWRIAWSSEDPIYGGSGIAPIETKANWIILGEAAVLLRPDENREPSDAHLDQAH